MRVFYMTTIKWAEVILRERRLKLSRFYEANDPFELLLIDAYPESTAWVAEAIVDYFDETTGMICMGSNWSSPVMWAHYAERHTGLAFGFDVPDELLKKVTYTEKKLRVIFGGHLPKVGMSQALLEEVISTKHCDWAYEREYRVMARLTTPDPGNGLYYTEFGSQMQLRELILGHRCPWSRGAAISRISSLEDSVRVTRAQISPGEFLMVEDSEKNDDPDYEGKMHFPR